MKRRDFMRAAGGTTAAAGATVGAAGPVAASSAGGGGEGGGQQVPVFGSYLEDANGYSQENVTDARGQDSVTIEVGAGDGLAFGPAAVWVSPGTTITWEWTGEGGSHNVVPNEGPAGFEHQEQVGESGHTYEYEVTEEDAGITTYFCQPHETSGMKGGVAVGDDVETTSLDSGVKDPAEFGTDIHEHWVGVTVVLTMSVSMVFTFFTLKYGESPHTSGGD
jgi:halocyanin-like protein